MSEPLYKRVERVSFAELNTLAVEGWVAAALTHNPESTTMLAVDPQGKPLLDTRPESWSGLLLRTQAPPAAPVPPAPELCALGDTLTDAAVAYLDAVDGAIELGGYLPDVPTEVVDALAAAVDGWRLARWGTRGLIEYEQADQHPLVVLSRLATSEEAEVFCAEEAAERAAAERSELERKMAEYESLKAFFGKGQVG